MSDKLRELLETWRSRLPYKGSEWMEEHDVIKELADELEECLNDDETLPTEPAPDREDAERYQWLVERGFVFRGCESIVDGHVQGEWLYRNHGADAAIDAARQEQAS